MSLLGPFFIEHPSLAWGVALFGIYVELVCVLIAFRPSLHRLWGVLLIGLHTGTSLILSVQFSHSMLLVGILFLLSPFQQGHIRLKDLPLFDLLFRIKSLLRGTARLTQIPVQP